MLVADRFAALSARERKLLFVGGVALLLFLAYLLLRPGSETGPVELAATPPPPVMAPGPPSVPLPLIIAPPPAPAPAASASTAGIVLQGVSGGGPGGGAALFQYPAGGQRLVRIGREILPGMILKSVGPSYALASSGGGDLRLELGKPGAVQVAAAAPVATASPAAATGPVADKVETTELRLGLQPVESGGRVRGYRFREGASLRRLQQAGLRPGDVITGVNGSVLDEERLMELSWSMSNSERTEFDVIRNGKPIKLASQPGAAR